MLRLRPCSSTNMFEGFDIAMDDALGVRAS
jgi:hypothetical protein